ncbi:uncharacterized protein LOC110834747 isoform X3 [Zootermopsis nevadensis]|uniref:uncharacterized protein LOC110834747 isoform X3 n=1 Tax=Zootermopsis nevadensis TaxID=136037 RepID=UPI000B8E5072|nr:uncharacterized protein LOC110834747 isoform X3 [Zootermopsis nevadensis]
MGNCCSRFGLPKIASSKSHLKNVVLLLVGLDNAGKTTAAKNLIGESLETVMSTVGFSRVSLTHQGCSVVIYDLGGGPKIRGIWHRYFADAHGIIFVVDASDVSRLEESHQVFANLLSHEKLEGKPVLLLANKQDCEGALDEVDIVDLLNVEAVVNQHRCPTIVEMCSATTVRKSHNKLDPAIRNGFRWLMNYIIREYSDLNSRVESDMAVQRKQIEQEKKERLERIRKAREERGESMADVVIANGTCNGGIHDDSDNDVVMANPFKPITDILEDTKGPKTPLTEPVLGSRVILVKESPEKIQPNDEEKQNSLDYGDGNKLTSNVKRFLDIDGDEVALVASADNRCYTGDNQSGSAAAIGQVPSPSHSITGLIKVSDQLESKEVQRKKNWFFHRSNRTAPAPLGPAGSQFHNSLDETDLSGTRNKKQEGGGPLFLRKEAFVEESNVSEESPVRIKKNLSVTAIPIREWSTDKRSMSVEDSYTTCHQLHAARKSVPRQLSYGESESRGTSRPNSAQRGEKRLGKQSLVDETSSTGTRSQMGSQHLSDSGFVSPKNVLPPIRLASSVDKPSWILPPLSTRTKRSSQDSLLGLDKPEAGAASAN